MKVTITPKSQRAKNRVAEHGAVMKLEEEGSWEGQTAIRVRSIKETWGSAGRKQKWVGWLTVDEADWTIHE